MPGNKSFDDGYWMFTVNRDKDHHDKWRIVHVRSGGLAVDRKKNPYDQGGFDCEFTAIKEANKLTRIKRGDWPDWD